MKWPLVERISAPLSDRAPGWRNSVELPGFALTGFRLWIVFNLFFPQRETGVRSQDRHPERLHSGRGEWSGRSIPRWPAAHAPCVPAVLGITDGDVGVSSVVQLPASLWEGARASGTPQTLTRGRTAANVLAQTLFCLKCFQVSALG